MPSAGTVLVDAGDNDAAVLDHAQVARSAPAKPSRADGDGPTANLSEALAEAEEPPADEEGGPPHVSPKPPSRASLAVITPRSARPVKKKAHKGKASAKKKGGKKGGPATPPLAAASGAAVATPGEDSAKKDKGKGKAKKPSVTLHSFFGKAGPSAKKGGGAKPKAVVGKPKAASAAASTASMVQVDQTKGNHANANDVSTATAKKGGAPKAAPKKKPAAKKGDGKGGDAAVPKPAKPPAEKAVVKPAKNGARDVSTKVKAAAPEQELDDTPQYALAAAMRSMTSKKRRGSRGAKAAAAASNAGANAVDDVPAAVQEPVDRKGGAVQEPSVDLQHAAVQEPSVDQKGAGANADETEDDAVAAEAKSADNEDSSNAVDAMVGVEEKTVDELLADAMEDEAVAAVEEEKSAPTIHAGMGAPGSAFSPVPKAAPKEGGVAEEAGDAMDVDAPEAVKEGAGAPDNAMEVDDAENEEVASATGANGDDASDGTVSLDEAGGETPGAPSDDCAEQASDVPVEVTAERHEEKPTEDEEVVEVGAPKKSVPEELLTEGEKEEESPVDEEVVEVVVDAVEDDADPVDDVEEARSAPSEPIASEGGADDEASDEAPTDEVVVVEAPKATPSKSSGTKKQGAKTTPKPRKKAPAGSSKKTAPKKKATPQKVNGLSPIAASLKKMAACPPKKSAPAKSKPSASTSVATADANKTTPGKSTTKAVEPKANLSEEDASRLRHYSALREKYVARALEVAARPDSDDFAEESLSLEGAADLPALEEGSVEVGDEGFPDALLTHLLLVVQGRSLPLSKLAEQALEQLSVYTTDARPLTVESISSKIKLLAQRKSYLSGTPPASNKKSAPASKLDCFENAEDCYMWRWELSSIDLIPQKEAAKAKKARTLRKKLQGHHRAILNLIAAVDKAVAWLQNTSKSSTPAAGEKLIAKVSDMEEKVLKFEREEEKARLLKEAKLQKERTKAEGQAAKQAEKQRKKEQLEEERRNEKKRKEEEKAQKKLEAAKAREEAKRKKTEEKELKKKQEELKKQQELEEKENKRKAQSAYMMSFFSKGSAKKKQKVASSPSPKKTVNAESASFDSDAFRKQIDAQDEHVPNPFAKHSKQSRESRRRKIGKVRVTVFVTVLSENAFAPQPYDEERVITVPNRYKFLGFHEDVRPPYRGTWSKTSSIINGRNGPTAKDTKYLDYDYESEAEWEEGDDEEGEDLQDGDDGADEEDDMQEEDNDGWLAAEDDLGIEDEDEDDETRELRKKKASAASAKPSHFKACVVAPRMGGLVHEDLADGDATPGVIEGFATPKDAMDILNSYVGCLVTPDASVCLDLFPPTDSAKESPSKKDGPAGTQKKEMTEDAQRTMAVFVHNSTHTSKEMVVTELNKAHPTITNSRAQAVRELDYIAEKRKLNGGGWVWEVKADHLKKLGLKKKDLKKPPKEASPQKAAAGEKKGKEKTKDPNAPKGKVSAYLFYQTATRNDVKAANPEASFGDIAKIISAKWKTLTPEERAPWDEKAAADKDRYEKEHAEYLANNPAASTIKTAASAPAKSPKSADGKAKKASPGKKRKLPGVSKASADLFANYMGVKPKKQKSEKSK